MRDERVGGGVVVAVHGPSQLLRPAPCPSCRTRQSRAGFGALAINDRSPLATAGSRARAGSKMNAASFARPSPLMSDATIGEYGMPELIRHQSVAYVTGATCREALRII